MHLQWHNSRGEMSEILLSDCWQSHWHSQQRGVVSLFTLCQWWQCEGRACWFHGGWEENWLSVGLDYPSLTITAWSLPNAHQRSVLWWCIQYVRSSIKIQVHCWARGPTPLCCSSPQFGSSLSLQDPILQEYWVIHNYSVKRQRALDKAIEVCTMGAKARKLEYACRTQWAYWIDSCVVFLELLFAVHTVVDAIAIQVCIKNWV